MLSFQGALHNSYVTVCNIDGRYLRRLRKWAELWLLCIFTLVHITFSLWKFLLYFHSLFVYTSIRYYFNQAAREVLLCNCCLRIFLTRAGNECHLHMLVEPSAISADSHVCSGLLSRVEKQLGVNRRKESAYTWAWPLSKWHQIALFIFFSVSLLVLQWSDAASSNQQFLGGNARLQQKQQLESFRDKCVLFSIRAEPFTQGLCRVFICEQQFHLAVFTPVSEIQ